MSNFAFLQPEWPEVFAAASRAESMVYPDPRAACFYARRALKFAVQWLYKAEPALNLPYQDNLAALLAEPSFAALATPRIATKTRLIKDLGNRAVHTQKVITQYDALTACRKFFQFTYWLAHRYARGARPTAELTFNDTLLPKTSPIPPQTQKKLEELANSLAEKDDKLSHILKRNAALDEEILRLRAEVAAAKAANEAALDTHDYNEAETRDAFIDLLLKEAGWALDQPRDREFPLTGMPNNTGEGFADCVLWGEDGNRRLVEKYSDASAWEEMGVAERGELVREVAGLPSGISDSDLDAKQFDLLLLGLQLAMLLVEPRFDALKESVIAIASALEEKQAIPMVRDQILLIQEVQRTQFWQSVTVPELEQVRNA